MRVQCAAGDQDGRCIARRERSTYRRRTDRTGYADDPGGEQSKPPDHAISRCRSRGTGARDHDRHEWRGRSSREAQPGNVSGALVTVGMDSARPYGIEASGNTVVLRILPHPDQEVRGAAATNTGDVKSVPATAVELAGEAAAPIRQERPAMIARRRISRKQSR